MNGKKQCIAAAVRIFGDRWTPLLIQNLRHGTLRFCQLQHQTGEINPRTLSQRMTMLEQEGIVTKTTFDCKPPRTEYTLTPKGKGLLAILDGMAAWSDQWYGKTGSDGPDSKPD